MPSECRRRDDGRAMYETRDTIRLSRTLFRGLRLRCPRCGKGRLFESFFRLRPRCEACDLDITSRSADTWAPIYLSTAGLTGVVIVGMLVLRPANMAIGRFTLAIAATTAIVLTLPSRKGGAIALNYFIEVRTGIGAPESDPT
jgi:uncharacterized protein (DUF983 family)